MSVTFAPDLPDKWLPSLEPCLCTQMDDRFGQWVRHGAGPAGEMRAAADPSCSICKGAGVEAVELPTNPQLNLSNQNAEALLSAMGIKQPYYQGEVTVAQARRGILRAKNTKFEVPPQPDWKAVFGGARVIGGEVTRGSVLERVQRFEEFVDTVAGLGAKKIRWY